jgi:two-component system chemotaxis sensor kinase CheA
MDDILREFVIETSEAIEVVDADLVRFEKEPNNGAVLAQIFRLVHTVKGTCGFLGLPRLEALAHAAETVIGQFRDGVPVTSEAVSLILSTIDRVKLIIAEIEANGAEPDGDDADLVAALEAMARIQATQRFADRDGPEHTTGSLIYQVLERPLKPGEVSLDDLERAFRDAPGPGERPAASAPAKSVAPSAPAPSAAHPTAPPAAAPPSVAAAAPPPVPEPAQTAEAAAADGADRLSRQTIRVQIETLDHLMTMVSELVLTRNQLLEIARTQSEGVFKTSLQRLSNITAELQDAVMKTRMQPIGAAWAKLPRLVRDLCQELGKDIELETVGSETEIDRHVLELIRDPLTHMIRNAADHGIEGPADRLAAGKKRRGRIRVAAFQEGGYIILEVSDDGRGIDVARVTQKLLAQGLATEEQLARLSDNEIARYVFRAGFSTASNVTNVSGRGVGMDVVATNVEQIGGKVDIRTTQGRGTTVLIKIPVTLAIAAALIVEAAGHRFAVPQLAVMELVRAREGGETRVEQINGSSLLRLRNELLPLADLRGVLGLAGRGGAADGFIVVCQVAGRRFGLVVDQVHQTEEIVVKPVSQVLSQIRAFSGATILGDGAVVMILDPGGIAHEVGAVSDADGRGESESHVVNVEDSDPTTALLVFKAGKGGYKAVPLAFVTRLEEIEASAIESANGMQSIQYRGKLMPLVALDGEAAAGEGRRQLLVFTHGQRSAGLVVDQIIDIVEEKLQMTVGQPMEGMVGSAIVSGRATDILDLSAVLPFRTDGRELNDNQRERVVLLIEPSEFFAALLAPVIKAAGFKVALARTAAEAAKLVVANVVDMVAIDLDQPDGGGYAVARRIKTDIRRADLPVLGLSSVGGEAVTRRGRDAGLDDIIGKYDRQGLISALREFCGMAKEAA